MKTQSILMKPLDDFFEQCHFLNFSNLDKVALFRCDYNNTHYRRDLFGIVDITFPSSLNKAVVKRQAEYLAGRYAARLTLRKLGVHHSDIPVGKHRNPIWPEGITASITHTTTSALCAAVHSYDIDYIGIDLENWMEHETVKEVKCSIIKINEEELLLKSTMDFDKAFTLVFSAKESLFKALYPSVGYYFDFTAAEVTNISIKKKTFELVLRENLTPELTSGTRFKGRFDSDSDSMLTLIAGVWQDS